MTRQQMNPIAFTGMAGMAFASALTVFGAPPRDREFMDTVYYDVADEATGEIIDGGFMHQLVRIPSRLHTLPAAGSEEVFPAGDPANRVDIVYVGDGYTAGELDRYAIEVDALIASYFNEEPYKSYAPYFNVHRVDVVSNESGVDNDPVQGIDRDTAMDMRFWCNGTERLLCVDVGKAYSYANNAPDVDLVAAVANSAKYGGGGYASADLATTSSRNSLSSEVILHEFGHSLGNLADEYNYGEGDLYQGGEPPEPNASIYVEAQMLAQQRKWWRWIGTNDPVFDGLVSTYEGCRYYLRGIYRPTTNSLMNNLNRPFNLPSVESLLIEIYKFVNPIDDSSDPNVVYDGSETLFVTPLRPTNHDLDIQWYLNGLPIPGADGETLDLSTVSLPSRPVVVSVTVTDDTDWVRDEAARMQWMTQTRNFNVDRPGVDDCLDLQIMNLAGGESAIFEVFEGTRGAGVAILWGTKDGSFNAGANGWCVDFGFDVPTAKVNSRIVTQGRFGVAGYFSDTRKIPGSAGGMEIRFQAAMKGTCPDACMSNIVHSVIR